jgi:hypothetical protein
MKLRPETLQKFMDLYEEEYGEKLSPAEAEEMASSLIHLYLVLARPLPSELAARNAIKHQDARALPEVSG